MPRHLGQKVLSSFGLGDKTGRRGSKGQGGPNTCDPSELPGKACLNKDERHLSKGGTYPRLARLTDGSIIAAFTRHQGGERILLISRSTDGGQSFTDWGEVARGTGDIDNMFLLEAAPSLILAAFRNHDLPGPSHFRITVCRSTDGGQSWSFLSQAADKSPPFGIWEPFMRLGRGGEVQLTYSQEFAPDDQRTMMVVSHDKGQSWSKPRCIEHAKERLRDGMNGIAPTKDVGNDRDALVMVLETTRYGPFNVEAVVSYDDGETWEHRHEVFTPPRGHNAGSPQIASFADGSLGVVFMTDEDSSKVDWVNNAATKVVFAGPPNNGKLLWSRPPVTVCPGSSFWPGIMALDHHNALVTYDYGGPKAKSITWQPK